MPGRCIAVVLLYCVGFDPQYICGWLSYRRSSLALLSSSCTTAPGSVLHPHPPHLPPLLQLCSTYHGLHSRRGLSSTLESGRAHVQRFNDGLSTFIST
ncbi:hypothetical protein JB92DRAFT_2904802 [Gautieria morchelliformis]|nr:hypothetical protein JB92DRAFT_2904802 [Gautieria morchelliformis]